MLSRENERLRPDYMAPSPRAIIESGKVGLESLQDVDDDNDELPPALGFGTSKNFRYYESNKALGHLYRAIDEEKFLRTMHGQDSTAQQKADDTLMAPLWDYVRRNNTLIEWFHHRHLAHQIKKG